MHLRPRTMVIFSIFIVIAIVCSLFIFRYKQYIDTMVRSYVDSITVCGNILDEQTCLARESCEPIYGPAGPNDPRLEFKNCQRKSLTTLVQEQAQKESCERTGGEWYENNLGEFCLCQKAGANMTFDRTQGCVPKVK